MDTHPDLLELELARTGEAPDAVTAHLTSCAVCQQELRALQALRDAHPAPPAIPLSVARDNMLLELAQDSARRVRARRRELHQGVRILRWAAPLTAAAGLVIAISAPLTMQRGEPNELSTSVLAGDVNADGRLDIVDALLLARALDEGRAAAAQHDLDHDLRVTARDVELIARQAVRLASDAAPVGAGSRSRGEGRADLPAPQGEP